MDFEAMVTSVLNPVRAKDGAMVKNNCHGCAHRRNIPGDCHIQCAKPDSNMTGNPHGIRSGWFMYPGNFDPCWMTAKCDNFKEKS